MFESVGPSVASFNAMPRRLPVFLCQELPESGEKRRYSSRRSVAGPAIAPGTIGFRFGAGVPALVSSARGGLHQDASIGFMALADIGRVIAGQALDTAKSGVMDAITGEPRKPSAASTAPAAPEGIGAIILGQIQAMQKSLKDDQELVVQFRSGEEMLRIIEIFVPSPQVFVLSGNDGQQRLTRIIAPAASVQLICKVLRITPGVTPVRVKIMTPNPRPPGETAGRSESAKP